MYPFFWWCVRVECVGGGIIGGSAHERHLLPPAPTEAAETQNECAECFCPMDDHSESSIWPVNQLISHFFKFLNLLQFFKKILKLIFSINFVKIQEKC